MGFRVSGGDSFAEIFARQAAPAPGGRRDLSSFALLDAGDLAISAFRRAQGFAAAPAPTIPMQQQPLIGDEQPLYAPSSTPAPLPVSAPRAARGVPAASAVPTGDVLWLEQLPADARYVLLSIARGIQTLYAAHGDLLRKHGLDHSDDGLTRAPAAAVKGYHELLDRTVRFIGRMSQGSPDGTFTAWLPDAVSSSIYDSSDPAIRALADILSDLGRRGLYATLPNYLYEQLPKIPFDPTTPNGATASRAAGAGDRRIISDPRIGFSWVRYVWAAVVGVAVGVGVYLYYKQLQQWRREAENLNKYYQLVEECLAKPDCDPSDIREPDAPKDTLGNLKWIIYGVGGLMVLVVFLPEIKGFFRLFEKRNF